MDKKQEKYKNIIIPWKGQSHEIFGTQFFHQSVHSGPSRDIHGPFYFFCFFIELLHF